MFRPSELTEVVYTPDAMRRQGWRVWRVMISELLASRELIWRLILRDITARYRQSVLGYVWAICPPLITVGTFAFLSRQQVIFLSDTPLPYPVYALWSLGVWQLFSGCLIACTNSLVSAGPLVTKVNFPKIALVAAAVGQPLIDFLIRLVPVVFVLIWFDVAPKWQAVFLPLILIPSVLLAVGIGLVLSIANLILRDVSNLLSMVLTVGMFLTPVLYPVPTQWPFALINILNPFSPLLIASQDLIAYGYLTMPGLFLMACLLSIFLLLLGWRVFHIAMPRISVHG